MNSILLKGQIQKINNFSGGIFSLVLLLLIFISYPLKGQTEIAIDELKSYSSNLYGTNDLLVNGWKYYPEHFNADGNPYFMDLDWAMGSVNTKGEVFNNVELLYNIQMDELILKQILKNGEPAFVMLNKDFIQSFTLGTHFFIPASKIKSNFPLSGFVEELYSGDFRFLIKHQKNFVSNYSANTPNGSISRQISNYYLLQAGSLQKISSKKALLKYFPESKKEIKSFLKKQKINFRKANSDQLKQLMDFCDEL